MIANVLFYAAAILGIEPARQRSRTLTHTCNKQKCAARRHHNARWRTEPVPPLPVEGA